MEVPFRIRRVTAADKEAVSALARAVDEDDYIPHIYDEFLAQPEPGGLFVAEQDGKMLACFSMSLTGDTDAYFWAMRVHPRYQGQGLGTQLCFAQIDYARRSGRQALYLLSEQENHRAHRLVQKCGFANLGPWIVLDEVRPGPQPAPLRARTARQSDLAQIRTKLGAQREPVQSVIAPPDSAWSLQTLRDQDFDLERMVVVEGNDGLDGILLYAEARDGEKRNLQIRLLEGTPAAAADLLAYMAAKTESGEYAHWMIGVPAVTESLLTPLGFDAERVFRAYVFCLSA